jgi:hypothetical protein
VTHPADAHHSLLVLISWAHSDADWTQVQVRRREQDVVRLAAPWPGQVVASILVIAWL